MQILQNNTEIKCTCGRNIDPFGDYFFSCTNHSKTKLHHHIRNAIYFKAKQLGKHANFIHNTNSCLLEKPGLLPSFQQLRPRDVILYPKQYNKTPHTNFIEILLAINCITIDEVHKGMETPADLHKANINHLKHYLNNEAKNIIRAPQKINNI